MLKIKDKKEINYIKEFELVNFLFDLIKLLAKNYGENRDIDKDLGGYILIVESLEDAEELKNGMLKDIIPEYKDEIICSEGVNYNSSLFLLFSDFLVIVIDDEELFKLILE
ncbi:hypothetical protein [Clostridium sp.]|uniref:hypothetical protein n=1 Tax=Clostridium sp. TaxID=1506 RepID=UPI0026060B4D|nr:hypothetical protein [Clostridium sp.]